jgi:hypothetical protein
MSEQLSNNQNNMGDAAPTGWEQLADNAPEATLAPSQEATASETLEAAFSEQDRAELTKEIKLLEQQRRQDPELVAKMGKRAREALLKVIHESASEYSGKLIAEDLDGDGIRNDDDHNTSAGDPVPTENSVSTEHIEFMPIATPNPEDEAMSDEEFDEWFNSVLVGLLDDTDKHTIEQPSRNPDWLDRWEEKKKSL